jgi:hypothetical protein
MYASTIGSGINQIQKRSTSLERAVGLRCRMRRKKRQRNENRPSLVSLTKVDRLLSIRISKCLIRRFVWRSRRKGSNGLKASITNGISHLSLEMSDIPVRRSLPNFFRLESLLSALRTSQLTNFQLRPKIRTIALQLSFPSLSDGKFRSQETKRGSFGRFVGNCGIRTV